MEKVLKYSILRYSPFSLPDKEAVLCILFSEETIGYHSFYYIQDLTQIQSFDDQLDLSILQDLLIGISEEAKETKFDIDSFIKFYINDYKFDKPRIITYQDLKETIATIKKVYFKS